MLSHEGSVLLIDGDSQQSAASWAAWRREGGREPAPTTISLAGKAILDEGKKVAAGFTHTVVDAGGRDAPGLRAALLLAERAIIPVGASSLDAAALDESRAQGRRVTETALLERALIAYLGKKN
jgi:chromosome partitioning protein